MFSVFVLAAVLNSPCRVSPAGVEFVKRFEGFRHEAYFDVNAWAVGYGTRGPGIKQGTRWSEEKSAAVLESSLDVIAAEICLIHPGLTQNQLDAYSSFTYNLGMGTLRRSGVLDNPILMLNYTKVRGVKLRGLVIRRVAEYQLINK